LETGEGEFFKLSKFFAPFWDSFFDKKDKNRERDKNGEGSLSIFPLFQSTP
jgi:hypothetical protein